MVEPLTEEGLRRALVALPDTLREWIGLQRDRTRLYLSKVGGAIDVVFQDERDATWRVWASEPTEDEAGVRPDLEQALSWSMGYAANGRVSGVQRDSEEDRVRARGLKEKLSAELANAARALWTPPPLALQLHLHRPRCEAAVSVLTGAWQCEGLSLLPATTRQIQLLAAEAPWSSDALPRAFLEALSALEGPLARGLLRVLVLDDLPVEHAMASAELFGGSEISKAWRAVAPHDSARLWAHRAEIQKLGRGLVAVRESAKPTARPSQTGFDFG